MALQIEKTHAGGFLVSEANGTRSRELVTLAASQTIVAGLLLGMIAAALEATSAAKSGGNTGNGTMSAVTVLPGAKLGVYTARFTAATAFTVEDPNGFVIGTGSTGAAFADDLSFTITAGGTAFVAGDGFDITVAADVDAANIGQYVALAPGASDGSEVAAAIAYDNTTTGAGETAQIVVIARDAEVNAAEIVYPAGATDPQKLAARNQLAALGIIAR